MNDNDVRKRILRAATRLFAHRGYGSTSVREVVQAAGVTKPSLYYYFSNKEGLFVDAVKTEAQWFIDQLEAVPAKTGSSVERIRAFLERYLGGVLENQDGARLLMTVKMPGEPDAGTQPKVDLMTLHRRTMEIASGLIAEGIADGSFRQDLDVRDAAYALIGTAHIHLLSWLHGQGISDDYCDRILNTFFQGVKA